MPIPLSRYFHCFERNGTDSSSAKTLRVRLLETPPPAAAAAVVSAPPGGWPHRCLGCSAGFSSRNALFKHLRKTGSCPASETSTSLVPSPASPAANCDPSASATFAGISASAKALVVAVQGVLRAHDGPIPLSWTVKPAKCRGALRRYARESGALASAADVCPPSTEDDTSADNLECGSLEPFQPRWWLVAMQALHTLLCSLPLLFELSKRVANDNNKSSSALSAAELRTCTVMENVQSTQQTRHDAAVAEANDAKSARAVVVRVVQLLEWQEIKSNHATEKKTSSVCTPAVSLGVLARDKGLQKHLGCRSLLPLLQEQCTTLQCNTGSSYDASAAQYSSLQRLRLVHEPTRGWCAQLVPLDTHAVTEATASTPLQHLGTRADDRSIDTTECALGKPLEVLQVFPGAVAINKPCGLSSEAVFEWLQNDPPHAVHEEIKRGEAQEQSMEYNPGESETRTASSSSEAVDRPGYRVESVSRLDKPTSGVVLVPLCHAAFHSLTKQFQSRTVEKTYLCLCQGVVMPETGEFSAKLRTQSRGRGSKTTPHPQGKEALTQYRRLGVYSVSDAIHRCDTTSSQAPTQTPISQEPTVELEEPELFSLCEVYPRTGRTHQIRAHFASSGYPLVGDSKYGGPPLPIGVGVQPMCATDAHSTTGRLFLHSMRLRFAMTWHGATQEQVQREVSAPLPAALSKVLEGMTRVDGM